VARQAPEDRRYQGEADFDPWKSHDFPVVVRETTRTVSQNHDVDRTLVPKVSSSMPAVSPANTKQLQILTTTDPLVADATAGGARGKLKLMFQYKFEPPYYRVRSVDCFSDKVADSLLRAAVDSGFHDAWMVPCSK